MNTYEVPALLDYGVTVIAVIVMGLMIYLFIRIAQTQHGVAHEDHARLVKITEALVDSSRDLADNVHIMTTEVARVHDDVWKNRQLLEAMMRERG